MDIDADGCIVVLVVAVVIGAAVYFDTRPAAAPAAPPDATEVAAPAPTPPSTVLPQWVVAVLAVYVVGVVITVVFAQTKDPAKAVAVGVLWPLVLAKETIREARALVRS